jgi:Xaa-Pro dipeptidase
MSVAHRLDKLRQFMDQNQLSAVVVTDPDNQFYYSGFKALIYSRPIYYVVTKDQTSLVLPGLEETHAKEESNVDNVIVYYEHPEKADLGKDANHTLAKLLDSIKGPKRVGVEFHATPIKLEKALRESNWDLTDTSGQIYEQRAIKDEQELTMMREAGRLVSLALEESLATAYEGITELEIDNKGNFALMQEIAQVHPNAVVSLIVMSPSGLERSIMPHVFSNTRKFQQGDVVIHSRQVALNGYRAECERTFFIGEPTPIQRNAFQVSVDAQFAALEVIKAGQSMKEVDWAARRIIQQAGFGEYSIHRVGHSIGLSAHEPPFLRFDEDRLLEEGMAFSIEPGIYIPGIGGYRHSDTIVVTKDGYELITEYPRAVDDLIFKL